MSRCRAWIPDFRTVNFLNLSHSSERPGRAAAHYPQKQNPAYCGVLPFSAPDGGGSGGTEAIRVRLLIVSRASFGEVQRSLAEIKSYAQVYGVVSPLVHSREIDLRVAEQRQIDLPAHPDL